MRYQRIPFPERLALIERRPDECWIWTWAKLPSGYGHFRRNTKDEYAHRAAYELRVGPIPHGWHLDHVCPSGAKKSCCNPAHLVPRTPAAHQHRHTGERTHCRKGHEYRLVGWHQFPCGQRYCQACYKAWYTARNERVAAAKRSLTSASPETG